MRHRVSYEAVRSTLIVTAIVTSILAALSLSGCASSSGLQDEYQGRLRTGTMAIQAAMAQCLGQQERPVVGASVGEWLQTAEGRAFLNGRDPESVLPWQLPWAHATDQQVACGMSVLDESRRSKADLDAEFTQRAQAAAVEDQRRMNALSAGFFAFGAQAPQFTQGRTVTVVPLGQGAGPTILPSPSQRPVTVCTPHGCGPVWFGN